MRLALAIAALVAASPAMAAEDYVCMNHSKRYPVSFDRDAGTLLIDRKPAQVEHTDVASQVVEIRGTIDLGNMFFWAALNNAPQIVYMKDQSVVRTDHCKFVDKPPT